jgi:hypothetical protein
MEINDLEKRVKELRETKLKEEAEKLKHLQEQQARQRIEQTMQGKSTAQSPEQSTLPKDNIQPGDSSGIGHPENKPELKGREVDLERIEAREASPTKRISPEGIRRIRGERLG